MPPEKPVELLWPRRRPEMARTFTLCTFPLIQQSYDDLWLQMLEAIPTSTKIPSIQIRRTDTLRLFPEAFENDR